MAKTLRFFVDPNFDVEDRLAIAQDAVDFIRERTRSGQGPGGKSLGNYSKAYEKHTDFIAAGKSNPVNLTLTGDMLDELDIIDVSVPGIIEIGYEEGTEGGNKAEWVQEKGYEFLALEPNEQEAILANYVAPTAITQVASGLSEGIASRLLSGIFSQND